MPFRNCLGQLHVYEFQKIYLIWLILPTQYCKLRRNVKTCQIISNEFLKKRYYVLRKQEEASRTRPHVNAGFFCCKFKFPKSCVLFCLSLDVVLTCTYETLQCETATCSFSVHIRTMLLFFFLVITTVGSRHKVV